ncbi:MAG: hypothetical protein PHN57_00400 [Candidatus Omnitrophica bacterium]|nr:hypothetical protein [Candidatus Omnitrophota bacterium]
MPDELIRYFYRKWKLGMRGKAQLHPDEETFASFLDDKLPLAAARQFKKHITECFRCAEVLAARLKVKDYTEAEVASELILNAKEMWKEGAESGVLEIFLKLKDKVFEIVNVSGEVLVGQELVPAAVLRSRNIKDFKDEVTVFKDFGDVRIEAKIESKSGEYFSLSVIVKEKNTHELLKDLRITLIKEDIELESCLNDSGGVCFEHVLFGKYTVEISNKSEKLASIKLEINK